MVPYSPEIVEYPRGVVVEYAKHFVAITSSGPRLCCFILEILVRSDANEIYQLKVATWIYHHRPQRLIKRVHHGQADRLIAVNNLRQLADFLLDLRRWDCEAEG